MKRSLKQDSFSDSVSVVVDVVTERTKTKKIPKSGHKTAVAFLGIFV